MPGNPTIHLPRAAAMRCLLLLALVLPGIGRAQILELQKVSASIGNLTGPLEDGDRFGSSVARLPDLDGDGLEELAVGAPLDDAGGTDHGAVWILHLDASGSVARQWRITDGLRGFAGPLRRNDGFGAAVASLGDLDGDGGIELAVGAPHTDGDGSDRGAVWILSLSADGNEVAAQREIGGSNAPLGSELMDFDRFGSSLATLGDLDGNGTVELAVGAPGADVGGPGRGAVWILSLAIDGSVVAQHPIAHGTSTWTGTLADEDRFGHSLAVVGDVDDDSVVDLAVGTPGDDTGGGETGAVWLLFLTTNGTSDRHHRFDATETALAGLETQQEFGLSLAALGDVDQNGVADLSVGSTGGLDPGGVFRDRGVSHVLLLNPDGSVSGHQQIIAGPAGIGGESEDFDQFGAALTSRADMDGNGVRELVVGTPGDDDGGVDRGGVWIVPLDTTGAGMAGQLINDLAGGLRGTIRTNDRFGDAVAAVGDLDGNGTADLLVGATQRGLAEATGAVWLLNLDRDGTVLDARLLDGVNSPSASGLDAVDEYGAGVAALGFDPDVGTNTLRVAVGAPRDDDGASDAGALWILWIEIDSGTGQRYGSVVQHRKISATSGGLSPPPTVNSNFGRSVANVGDLDGNGWDDVAVGAPLFGSFPTAYGAVWILFLAQDGNVIGAQRITPGEGGFVGPVTNVGQFGTAVALIGDLDGDGRPELAVGAAGEPGGASQGAVWILSLDSDGTVIAESMIAPGTGAFEGTLLDGDEFGRSVAALGDRDLDGIADLAIGAPGTLVDTGALYLLSLTAGGTVRQSQRIDRTMLPVLGDPENQVGFGASVALLGDVDGDGIADLTVGAPGDDDGGQSGGGAIWNLRMSSVPPRLVEATPTSIDEIRIRFSEAVQRAGAEDPNSYVLTGEDQSSPAIADAGLQPDGASVLLLLREPLKVNVSYTLRATGIVDRGGSRIDPDADQLPFEFPPAEVEIPTQASRYITIGLPLEPLHDSAIRGLRALGPSGPKGDWRLFRRSDCLCAYEELTTDDDPNLRAGEGFWLITRNANLLRVGGFAVESEAFEVPLREGSGGYNLISNPFADPVPVANLQVAVGNQLVGLLDTGGNRFTDDELISFSGDAWITVTAGDCLLPGVGYWIRNRGDDVDGDTVRLLIPPPTPGGTPCSVPGSAKGSAPQLPDGAKWAVSVQASSDAGRSLPVLAGITDLVNPRLDRHLPPPPPSGGPPQLSVTTDDGAPRRWSFLSAESTARWDLRLDARSMPVSSDELAFLDVELRVEPRGLPGDAKVILSDAAAGWSIPLDVSGRVSVSVGPEGRRFRLEVRDDGSSQPVTSSLRTHANPPFPNPFPGRTAFGFELAGASTVTVDVYDVAGRRVRRLDAGLLTPGEHLIPWDGNDDRGRSVSSGVYHARYRVDGRTVATHRVLKLR